MDVSMTLTTLETSVVDVVATASPAEDTGLAATSAIVGAIAVMTLL